MMANKDIKGMRVGSTKTVKGKQYVLNKSHRWENCPGSKIRSKGKGRGLGIGGRKGPIGRRK